MKKSVKISIFLILTILILILAFFLQSYQRLAQINKMQKIELDYRRLTKEDKFHQIKHLNTEYQAKDSEINAINDALNKEKFSGTALVIKNQKVLLNKGYGYSNRLEKIKNNVNTVYSVASLQKAMTAVLLMQLSVDNKVNLNTTIDKYFPEVENADKITIRNLLTMTSGLTTSKKKDELSPNEYLQEMILNLYQKWPIGEWHYNEMNFRLLTEIIQKESHESYQKYFDDYFLKKYQINAVDFSNFSKYPLDKKTLSYKKENSDDAIEQNEYPFNKELGVGDHFMTAHDLYKFYYFLLNDIFLSKNVTQNILLPLNDDHYAAGLYNNGSYYRGHGLLNGFEASVYISADAKDAVILLSNQDKKKPGWQPLAKSIFEKITGESIDS